MLDNENVHGVDAMILKLKKAEEYVNQEVPQIIGTEAVKHFKRNFFNESFDDNKWDARKTKPKLERKILTGPGSGDHLGDSIDFRVNGMTITIYTDKKYAQIHNEGGTIVQTVTPKQKKFFWAKHKEAKEAEDDVAADNYKAMALSKELTIKIPKREFMGNSPQLNDIIISKIKRDLTAILK